MFLPLLLSLAPYPFPNISFYSQVFPITPLPSLPFHPFLTPFSFLSCSLASSHSFIPWQEIACSEGGRVGKVKKVRERTSRVSPCYRHVSHCGIHTTFFPFTPFKIPLEGSGGRNYEDKYVDSAPLYSFPLCLRSFGSLFCHGRHLENQRLLPSRFGNELKVSIVSNLIYYL